MGTIIYFYISCCIRKKKKKKRSFYIEWYPLSDCEYHHQPCAALPADTFSEMSIHLCYGSVTTSAGWSEMELNCPLFQLCNFHTDGEVEYWCNIPTMKKQCEKGWWLQLQQDTAGGERAGSQVIAAG